MSSCRHGMVLAARRLLLHRRTYLVGRQSSLLNAMQYSQTTTTTIPCVTVAAASPIASSPTSSPHHHRTLSSSSTSSSSTNSTEFPPHTLFPMPALSPTMESGSIASWTIGPGDSFGAGEALCLVDTDKASVEFEAQDDGILAKILVEPGVDVPVGTPICVVVEDGADVAAFADFVGDATPDRTAAPAPPATTAASTTNPSLLFPSARHLSESNGKDATGLVGSGKGGRVTKGDVLAALQTGSLPDLVRPSSSATASAPSPTAAAAAPLQTQSTSTHGSPVGDLPVPEIYPNGGAYEDTPNNKMRKIIASRLTQSKRDVPHSYTTMPIALDNILALRKQLKQDMDTKVSVNDFVLRASALALRDVPEVNATYVPTMDTGVVQHQPSIDVSVAVATPTGLITPIVFAADRLGLSEMSHTVADLAGRAREGRLQPHEYQGGTFSVSNLGMFGVSQFAAVINPPQAAILAVGGGAPTLMPTEYVLDGVESAAGARTLPPTMETVMTATLSADRRVVDDATAALFLQAVRAYMQNPERMLL